MKNSITVLGVEAEGIRGIRLAAEGTAWRVADDAFWPIGGTAAAADGSAGEAIAQEGGAQQEDAPEPDRYAALVEALAAASKRFGTREVVLAMPLSGLLVRVARTPVEDRERLAELALAELGKVSPFPDESPVAGIETVAESDRELTSVFAALPAAEAAEIGDALDEAKVRVVRTDIAALGWLRMLWPRIAAVEGRKAVLMNFGDGWDVAILDGGAPTLLRGLGSSVADPAEIAREVMLSLLRAGPAGEPAEIVIFAKDAPEAALTERLGAFGPVRVERVEEPDGGVEGVARRTQEGATLDVTPADWAELRTEARFTRKLVAFLAVAAAGWLLLMGVLFGVPFAYGQMTERQKTLSKRHAAAYRDVKEMRDKVKLVQQYSDHARGSLEMLKAVSDRLPEGITLTSFSYKRGERLSIVGEAARPTDVYAFKNALTEAETEDEEKLFADVTLTGPSQSRGVHKFTIEGSFEAAEEGK